MSLDGPAKRRRSRSDSTASSSSAASTSSAALATKVYRQSSPPPPLFTCTLAPTCSTTPSVHATSASLDAHHATYHSFVCHASPIELVADPLDKGKHPRAQTDAPADAECGRVFPSQRFLDLHLTECHDPLAAVRLSRGDKIFACFQADCHHLFATAKGRRRHLIDKHQYPNEFFFAVTLWGVQDVLRKGGGMVRREWKPRDGSGESESSRGGAEGSRSPEPSFHHPVVEPPPHTELTTTTATMSTAQDKAVDGLADSFASAAISMVPRSVRGGKGRGGKGTSVRAPLPAVGQGMPGRK